MSHLECRTSSPIGRSYIVMWTAIHAIFFLSVTGKSDSDQQLDAIAIQSSCLEYRNRVTESGFVFLDVQSEQVDGSKVQVLSHSEHRIWFSGPQLRFDIRGMGQDKKWGDWERFCVNNESYIWIPRGAYDGTQASIDDYRDEVGGVMGHFNLYHPRWIGMGQNHESMLQRIPGTRFIDPSRQDVDYSVTRETLLGHHVSRVSNPMNFPGMTPDSERSPGELVMWFSEDAFHQLIRLELTERAPTFTHTSSVNITLKQYTDGNIWFPENVVYESIHKGVVRERRVVTINDAQFGKSPPPQTFTVASMELPAGKRVSDRSQGPREKLSVSDGLALIPVSGEDLLPAPPPASRLRGILLWVNTCILGIIGLAILVRKYRSTR